MGVLFCRVDWGFFEIGGVWCCLRVVWWFGYVFMLLMFVWLLGLLVWFLFSYCVLLMLWVLIVGGCVGFGFGLVV